MITNDCKTCTPCEGCDPTKIAYMDVFEPCDNFDPCDYCDPCISNETCSYCGNRMCRCELKTDTDEDTDDGPMHSGCDKMGWAFGWD